MLQDEFIQWEHLRKAYQGASEGQPVLRLRRFVSRCADGRNHASG